MSSARHDVTAERMVDERVADARVADVARSGAAAPPTAANGAERRAVAAFAQAVRLSCQAAGRPARDPTRFDLANRAVAAHMAARAWAEEAVRRAAHG